MIAFNLVLTPTFVGHSMQCLFRSWMLHIPGLSAFSDSYRNVQPCQDLYCSGTFLYRSFVSQELFLTGSYPFQELSLSETILFRNFALQKLSFSGTFPYRSYPFQEPSLSGTILFRKFPSQERFLSSFFCRTHTASVCITAMSRLES